MTLYRKIQNKYRKSTDISLVYNTSSDDLSHLTEFTEFTETTNDVAADGICEYRLTPI